VIEHPRRLSLNEEMHARPPEAISAPAQVSYFAFLADEPEQARQWRRIADLCLERHIEPPRSDAIHFAADFGSFRLKAERHTEFIRLNIMVEAQATAPMTIRSVADCLPAGWLDEVGGQLLVAANIAVAGGDETGSSASDQFFAGHTVIGSDVAGGGGTAMTDLRIGADGASRFLVVNRTMTPRQCGRMIQRLVEIETYSMLALLALPVARALSRSLANQERELAQVTGSLASGEIDDMALLERLTRLGAAVDSSNADQHYRFSASRAYYDLVRRRIDELRENRIAGLQTFKEFMERRLAPAMATCKSVSDRLEALSQHVERATQLLSTRIAIARERQNQEILATMNRRVALQLRLQQTVEGLSVAAISYYVVGLIGQFAAGATVAFGIDVRPGIVVAASIPLVIAAVAFGVRRLRMRALRDSSP